MLVGRPIYRKGPKWPSALQSADSFAFFLWATYSKVVAISKLIYIVVVTVIVLAIAAQFVKDRLKEDRKHLAVLIVDLSSSFNAIVLSRLPPSDSRQSRTSSVLSPFIACPANVNLITATLPSLAGPCRSACSGVCKIQPRGMLEGIGNLIDRMHNEQAETFDIMCRISLFTYTLNKVLLQHFMLIFIRY